MCIRDRKVKVASVPAPDMKYIMSHGMSDQTFADTAKKTFSDNPADKTIGKDGYSTQNKFTAELMRRQSNTGKDFSGNPLYKKKEKVAKEEYTPYDIVLEYLLSSEQAATIEEANYVMTEMDVETIQGIVEEQKKNSIVEKTGVFKSDKLNKMYPDQPEMTDKGKQILPNLPDPTIIKGKKVVYKEKRPRVFGDPTGEMTKDFFK